MLLRGRVAPIVAVALAKAALSRLVLVDVDGAVDVEEGVLVDVAAELGGRDLQPAGVGGCGRVDPHVRVALLASHAVDISLSSVEVKLAVNGFARVHDSGVLELRALTPLDAFDFVGTFAATIALVDTGAGRGIALCLEVVE